MFGGKNIVLQQWHPRMQFDKNKISTLPVWIRLHGLPFPLWSKQGLSLAASMVGRPLSCDESTYNCTRLEYARICVEIDASLPYIHGFDIDSPLSSEPIAIKVEYEWKPTRCAKCSVFGHSCPLISAPAPAPDPVITVPVQDKGKTIAIDPLPLNTDSNPSSSNPVVPTTNTLTVPITTNPSLPILHKDTVPAPLNPDTVLNPIQNIAPASLPPATPSTSQPPPTPTIEHANDLLNKTHKEPSPQVDASIEFHHSPALDTIECMESKMDSLKSHSDAFSAVEVSAENSTASIPPNDSHADSPVPSPKTNKKKKGGRKRKEAKGL